MRRLLRDVAEERALGDVTTLLDPNVVSSIRDRILAGGAQKEDEE
jgi:acetyl-CoA synthetase